MNTVLKILARLGLGLTIIPSILFLFDSMSLETVKIIMIIGLVLWFATAPLIQKTSQERLTHAKNRDNI